MKLMGKQAAKVHAKCRLYKTPGDVPGAFAAYSVKELKKHGLPVFNIGLNREFYPVPYKVTESVYEDYVGFYSSRHDEPGEWVLQSSRWHPSEINSGWFVPASFLEESNELGEVSL